MAGVIPVVTGNVAGRGWGMSEGNERAGAQPRRSVRNPKDFYGGLALAAVALVAFAASSNLEGMQGFTFGPGTAPRLFASLLLLCGAAVALNGRFGESGTLERYAVRGPLLTMAAILFFALTVRPLGLVLSSFVTVLIAAAASPESRVLESVIWAALLSAFCALLFNYALGLPMELWPLTMTPLLPGR